MARLSAALNVNAQTAIADSVYARLQRLDLVMKHLVKGKGGVMPSTQEIARSFGGSRDSWSQTGELGHYKRVLEMAKKYPFILERLKFENDFLPEKSHRLKFHFLYNMSTLTLEKLAVTNPELCKKVWEAYLDILAPMPSILGIETAEIVAHAGTPNDCLVPRRMVVGKERGEKMLKRCLLGEFAKEAAETALAQGCASKQFC